MTSEALAKLADVLEDRTEFRDDDCDCDFAHVAFYADERDVVVQALRTLAGLLAPNEPLPPGPES